MLYNVRSNNDLTNMGVCVCACVFLIHNQQCQSTEGT